MVNNSKTPKISILLPTHNRADVIGFAIESVLYQTQQDFELQIVGDGCTDNTAEVVSKYLSDDRIRWFDFPKGKYFGYDNRNKALKTAKGKYIGFMAHDDILFPDHLEKLSTYLDADESLDIVCSRPLWVDEKGWILPSSYNILDKRIFDFFMNVGNGIPASCFLHRSSCFETVGYWDENVERAADWEYWKKIIRSKNYKNYTVENDPTVFHFKAVWKNKSQTWPDEIWKIIEILNQNPDLVPTDLKVNVPNPLEEQSIFWNKISQDLNWLSRIRKSSFLLHDNLIHFSLPETLAENNLNRAEIQTIISEKDNHINNLNAVIHSHEAQIQELNTKILGLEGSAFFKLRKLIIKLFPKTSIQYRIFSKLRRSI